MRYLFNILANHGFIYPAIGIAQALQQRGHTIAFTTNTTFADSVNKAGFEYIPIGSDHASFTVPDWGTGLGVLRQIQHVDRAIDLFNPDVLVGSALTLSVPIMANWHNLPCATIGLGSYIWPERNADPNPTFDSMAYIAQLRYKENLELYTAISKHFGLPVTLGDVDSEHSLLGDLYLLRSCPALQQNIAALPAQVHCVGACLWEPDDTQLDANLAAFVARDRPIIYVQHDNRWSKPFMQNGQQMCGIPDFWDYLVNHFTDSAYDIVAATGDAEIAARDWGDNFFVRRHISHQAILPHAHAVIATGTSSIMLSTLTHGLPLLLITTGSEAYNVAELCEGAGVALAIQAHYVDQASFTAGVGQLLDDGNLRHHAERVQSAFAAFAGATTAASLLEQLGRKKQLIKRAVAFA